MKNGGQCGTCGDPYDDPHPEHEAGGRFATGTIVKYYPQYTSQIPVTIDVTAHHKGKTVIGGSRGRQDHPPWKIICGYRFSKKFWYGLLSPNTPRVTPWVQFLLEGGLL